MLNIVFQFELIVNWGKNTKKNVFVKVQGSTIICQSFASIFE